jgi:hypothetical protein
MATLGGAIALGLGDRVGSLVPGKQADMAAIRCDTVSMTPMYSPLSHVVYVASKEEYVPPSAGRRLPLAPPPIPHHPARFPAQWAWHEQECLLL